MYHFKLIIMFVTTSRTVRNLSTTFLRTIITGARRPTLRLEMPNPISGWNETIHLRDAGIPLHPSSPHLQSSKLSITLDPFHRGDHTYISRGTLTSMKPHDDDLALPVVAKMSICDNGAEAWVLRLKEEAQFYSEELLSFQGQLVPKFYGLYVTKSAGNRQFPRSSKGPVSCMLLEDCGDVVPQVQSMPIHIR